MGKVAVLGLGESLKLWDYSLNDYECVIGVNDIWRAVKTEYVVCVDARSRFTEDRLAVIDACRPRAFYSHLPEWARRPDYKAIKLQDVYPKYVCQLDVDAIPKSMCSPFVAAAIAYKLHGASEIHLYGVDLVNHPHLNGNTVERIVGHFRNLKAALGTKGVNLIAFGSGALRLL